MAFMGPGGGAASWGKAVVIALGAKFLLFGKMCVWSLELAVLNFRVQGRMTGKASGDREPGEEVPGRHRPSGCRS